MGKYLTCKIVFFAALFVATIFISGCPFPIPPDYSPISRENLTTAQVNQIQTGLSSREDVLLLLGEPDVTANDESWMVYGSIRGKGGVAFILFVPGGAGGVATEKVEYNRLVIFFDRQGVVSSKQFVSQDCWEAIMGADSGEVRTAPCLQIYEINMQRE